MGFIDNIEMSLCLTLDNEESSNMFDMIHSNFLEVADIWIDKFLVGTDCKDVDELPPVHADSVKRKSWTDRTNAYNAYRAHRAMIERAVDEGVENLLIVEDDAVLRPAYFEWVVSEASLFLDSNPWDMIYLGSYYRKHGSIEVASNVIRLSGETGWHCVLLNRTMFGKLLDLPVLGPMDWMCSQTIHGSHMCYGLTPSVSLQLETYSNIEEKTVSYNNFLV